MQKITLSLVLTAVLGLTGCMAEDDDEVTNEQGQTVTDQTVALSGFWDGQLNQTTDLRLLIYNGNVYGRDADNGYYGTITLNAGDQTSLASLTSYAMNAGSDTAANQLIADGNSAAYEFDTQLSSLSASNDSLFGPYNVDNTPTGNVQLTRDGTWDNNSPLSALTKTGKWTASTYELVITRAGDSATFTGVSTDAGNAGCNFRGRLSNIDSNYNLYRATLTQREDCVAFNTTDVSGFAGFNTDGELEFYFRDNNAMLFMTFTPPADQTSGGDSGDGSTPDEGGGGAEEPAAE